jgi:hypothetical protein
MEKISHEKVAEVLNDAATALRAVTAERDGLQLKLASIERHQEAEKLAHEMTAKGLGNNEPFEQLVTNLEKMAESGKLGELKRAVGLVGPDMGRKLASLTNDDQAHVGGTDLVAYITSSIG